MYPWRTINGEEASAYYAAGTAQYHINADIMYALRKYVQATGDEEFLFDEGVEMLVETARLWLSLGFYSPRKGGQFCIHCVTGPDEYNTVVDNNVYTNLMARENLRYAAETVEKVRERRPDLFTALVHKTHLDIAEIDGLEAGRRAHVRSLRPTAQDHSTGRSVLGTRTLGLQAHAAGQVSSAVVLPPTDDLSLSGPQAGRSRAGHVPARVTSFLTI